MTRPRQLPNAQLPSSALQNPKLANMAFVGDDLRNAVSNEQLTNRNVASILPLID
jgi:hypothetical protein